MTTIKDGDYLTDYETDVKYAVKSVVPYKDRISATFFRQLTGLAKIERRQEIIETALKITPIDMITESEQANVSTVTQAPYKTWQVFCRNDNGFSRLILEQVKR